MEGDRPVLPGQHARAEAFAQRVHLVTRDRFEHPHVRLRRGDGDGVEQCARIRRHACSAREHRIADGGWDLLVGGRQDLSHEEWIAGGLAVELFGVDPRRSSEGCHGAGQVGFRVSSAGGNWTVSVNPGAGVTNGRIRIFNACYYRLCSAPGTGHVKGVHRDVGVAGRGGTSHRNHHRVTPRCEAGSRKHDFGRESGTSRGNSASGVD